MIEKLTDEQIARFPDYVKKWTDIGLSTEPLNFEEAKRHAADAYKVAKLEPPKYWFRFGSPETAVNAIFMVDSLSNFSDKDTDTEVVGDTSKWIKIFDNMYEQYSAQFKDIEWNDNVKARMLSVVSKAYAGPDLYTKLKGHFDNFMYGNHDAAWLSFYDFFYQEFDLECTHDLIPSFELAKNCGWWSAYGDVCFLQDRPSKIVMNEENVLHNENGPAIEYPDGSKVYCLEGMWFPEVVVMDPHLISLEMIDEESNSEKRRIMLERYGYERYFQKANCTVIDQDEVQVAINDERKMPRMLVQTSFGDRYFIGTDGSTNRVYFMNVTEDVKTCVEAHVLISGLDEDKCLAQS